MPRLLPLFPLRLVVYPGEQVNLHIFEERYKQLITDIDQSGGTFGIPAFINDKMMEVGTELMLVGIDKMHPNGEMDIITKGVGSFRIMKVHPKVTDKLYSGADVETIQYTNNGSPQLLVEIKKYFAELNQLLSIRENKRKHIVPSEMYDIGHDVGLTLEQEYELLCFENESDKQKYMIAHFNTILPVVRKMQKLRDKAKLNGHFKHLKPPDF